MNEHAFPLPATFLATLEEALTHYADPAWLGSHSLLASPYLLAAWAPADATAPIHYGRALQALLRTAVDSLDGKYAERQRTILQEYYFHNRPLAVLYDLVGLSRNAFNVNRNAAIEALAHALIMRLRPALRLERPPPPGMVVERDQIMLKAAVALREGQTVALLGTGGTGKTTLGLHLAQTYEGAYFWYTLRPGLNDQMSALLFALGLFAWQQQSPALWLELVATQGKLALEKALALVRHVLAHIHPRPLLCIDELDLLQPAHNPAHSAMIQFIESLHGQAPLLLIGQRAVIDTDYHFTLQGLSPAGLHALLTYHQLRLAAGQSAKLYDLTQGNPRLLKLFILAAATGETPDELLAHLPATLVQTPGVEFMLNRILQRLNADERRLLVELSVFPTPAPPQSWQTPQLGHALRSLLDKQLVQGDARGGIEIPWVYRQVLYTNLPVETHERLHIQAAHLRTREGAYTAALYHWVMAREAEEAIKLWYEHQPQEIAQGQAGAALQLLRSLPAAGLTPVLQEQHAIMCAQLEYLVGNFSHALEDLRTLLHKTALTAVAANELTGVIANELNDFAQAGTAFQRALALSQTFVELRDVHIRKGLAWMHWRQFELEQAERELNQAAYEVENMRGRLAEMHNNYTAAIIHYQTALHLAENIHHTASIAKTCTSLGGLMGLLGEAAPAGAYLNRAYEWYQQTGKVLPMAGNRMNLAVTQLQVGEPQAALAALQEAEALLADRALIPPRQHALLHQIYAEVYLKLGELAAAQQHARTAIESEEIEVLPDVYRIYGEILSHQGEYQEAEHFLHQSIDLAEQTQDHNTCGYGWRTLAQIYAQQGHNQAAEAAFHQAMEQFEASRLWHEVEQTRQSQRQSGLLAIAT